MVILDRLVMKYNLPDDGPLIPVMPTKKKMPAIMEW